MNVQRIKYTGIPEERVVRQSARTVVFFVKLLAAVLRLRPDAIVAQRVYDLGLYGGIIGKILRCRAIAYAHGPDEIGHADILRHRRTLNRLAGRLNHAVAATNTHHAKYLEENIGKSVVVIPNIAHVSLREGKKKACRRLGLREDQFHLLFVGRLCLEQGVETKGFSFLLKAMPAMPLTHLHVVGDGPLLENYRKVAGELGISDRVTFHGKISSEGVNGLMCATDALVVPSLLEGCSLTVLEAMSLGLPVIASPVGGLLDLVRDGETGLQLRVSDSASIVEQVTRARTHPELTRKIAADAKRFVEEYAGIRAVAEKFRSLLG